MQRSKPKVTKSNERSDQENDHSDQELEAAKDDQASSGVVELDDNVNAISYSQPSIRELPSANMGEAEEIKLGDEHGPYDKVCESAIKDAEDQLKAGAQRCVYDNQTVQADVQIVPQQNFYHRHGDVNVFNTTMHDPNIHSLFDKSVHNGSQDSHKPDKDLQVSKKRRVPESSRQDFEDDKDEESKEKPMVAYEAKQRPDECIQEYPNRLEQMREFTMKYIKGVRASLEGPEVEKKVPAARCKLLRDRPSSISMVGPRIKLSATQCEELYGPFKRLHPNENFETILQYMEEGASHTKIAEAIKLKKSCNSADIAKDISDTAALRLRYLESKLTPKQRLRMKREEEIEKQGGVKTIDKDRNVSEMLAGCVPIPKPKEKCKRQRESLPVFIPEKGFTEVKMLNFTKKQPGAIVKKIFEANIGKALTDVGGIDYVPERREENLISLKGLGEVFCDSFVLFGIFPDGCMDGLQKTKYLKKQVTSAILGAITASLTARGLESNLVTCTPVKLSSNCMTANMMCRYLRSNRVWLEQVKKRYAAIPKYGVRFKCACARTPFDKLVRVLEAVLRELETYCVFLHDLDVTLDCIGTMRKTNIEQCLLAQGFVKGDDAEDANLRYIDLDDKLLNLKEESTPVNLIMESTNAGDDCATYVSYDNDSRIRCKLYNKFVCTFTSGGSIQDKFGNQITHYLKKDFEVLGEKYYHPEVLSKGITRLEMSLYSCKLRSLAEYQALFAEHLFVRVANKLIFYEVPLAEQWELIAARLKSSMMIFDHTHLTGYAAFWGNSVTGRIEGTTCQKKTPEEFERLILHYKALFSFVDLPCHVLDLHFAEQEFYSSYSVIMKSSSDNLNPVQGAPTVLRTEEKAIGVIPGMLDASHIITYCTRNNTLFSSTDEELPFSMTCFANTRVKFGLLNKRFNLKSQPLYVTKIANELMINIELINKKQIDKIKARQVEEEKITADKSKIAGLTGIIDEHQKLKLEEYNEKLKEKHFVTMGLRILAERMTSRARGLFIRNSRYVIKALKITTGKLLIMLDHSKGVLYGTRLIWWFLGSKSPLPHIPLGQIKKEWLVEGSHQYIQSPGESPLFSFVVNRFHEYKGREEAVIDDFRFEEGWSKLKLQLKEEEDHEDDDLEEKKKELIENGGKKVDVAPFVYDPNLKTTKVKDCRDCNLLAEGTIIIIKRLYEIEYRKKPRFLFKGEQVAGLVIDKSFAPFISNLSLSEKLSEIGAKTPFRDRLKTITIIARERVTNPNSKKRETKFEVQENN